jgi:serine protease
MGNLAMSSASVALSSMLLVASSSCAGVETETETEEAGLVEGLPTTDPYSPAYQHPYRLGVVPTSDAHERMKAWRDQVGASVATTGPQTLSYGGGNGVTGVQSGTVRVILVVWGSQWGTWSTDANGYYNFSNDPAGAVPYEQKLFKGLGTGGELWSSVMTQYCDGPSVGVGATFCPPDAWFVHVPVGGVLPGASVWYDGATPAPAQATPEQIAQEAIKAAQAFGLTTPALNRNVQFVVLSPTGTQPDGFNTPGAGFCAWHGATSSPYGKLAFTNMPYLYDAYFGFFCGAGNIHNLLGAISIVASHEYAETVTDPVGHTGWVNRTGTAFDGEENGDECRDNAGYVTTDTGTFALQATWSNATNRCELTHPALWNTPTTLSLLGHGGIEVGSSVWLTNRGHAPLTAPTFSVTRVAGTVGSLWIDPAGCGATLSPGAICSFRVNFEPGCGRSVGASRWSVSINAGGAGAPIELPVTGTTTPGICL